MGKITSLLLLAFASLISVKTQAAVLFEPYGGYSVGNISTTTNAGASDSGSANGFGYGGRVGFLMHHFVVLSAEYQAINAKEQLKSSAATQTDWKSHALFATIGFQAPRGFRLLGSYGWDAQTDEATTPNATRYKGTAAKLLIGWHLPTTMAINLEYTIYHYTDSTVNGVTSKIGDSYTKFDNSSVMATISFPFTFFGGMGRSHSSSSHASDSPGGS